MDATTVSDELAEFALIYRGLKRNDRSAITLL
jgi:hypothetical protein